MLTAFVLLISILGGSLSQDECDSAPCQQSCVSGPPGSGQYVCTCYENWELTEDEISCTHVRSEDVSNLYLGCYAENSAAQPDFEHFLWDKSTTGDASVENCLHDCRTHSFLFAGLRNGGQCWCTNNVERIHGESTNCASVCSGEFTQICGGTNEHSVYAVTQDKRFIGCYNEDLADPDLDAVMWENTEVKSPQECVVACSEAGFNFAGVMDGGRCACGDTYGKHSVAPVYMCNVTCETGFNEMNCGGENTNAMYRVVRAMDYSLPEDAPVKYASVPADMLTEYPHTSGFLTRRMVLYASDVVLAPYEDSQCYQGNCYTTCGEIHRPPGIDYNKKEITIRQFFIRLSEIPQYITAECEKIYVFAQTLVIDQSTTFNVSIYMRARQIIINYEASPDITFPNTGAEFNYSIGDAVHRGPPSDLAFQKLSAMCSRILMNSPDEEDRRIGWAILDDIARDNSYDMEQKAFMDSVRNAKYAYEGLDLYGVHYAPISSKSRIQSQLETYFNALSLYWNEYNEMMEDIQDCLNFEQRAMAMVTIWADMYVNEAKIIAAASLTALEESQHVYQLTYLEFNESRYELKDAAVRFKEGIKRAIIGILLRGLLSFVDCILNMSDGKNPTGAAQAQDDITSEVPELEEPMDSFDYIVENLAKVVNNIEVFLGFSRNMMTGLEVKDGSFNWTRYDGVVNKVAKMYVIAEEWQNLAEIIDAVLQEDTIRGIDGATGFRIAAIDLCTWGEALTRSLIEHGENMRQAIATNSIYITRELMRMRYDAYARSISMECDRTAFYAQKWAEQSYDVVIDANQALITYCQAHFYEKMAICPSGSRPDFSASMLEMMGILLSASSIWEDVSRTSPFDITISITDEDTSPECSNVTACPVYSLRNESIFYYKMPRSQELFNDLDILLVEEVQVIYHGVRTTDPDRQQLALFIESSGPFENVRNNQWETFLTQALSGCGYGYQIDNPSSPNFRCDMYPGVAQTVKHLTPFTTWMISLQAGMSHIDLSEVTSVDLRFQGSFSQGGKTPILGPNKPHLA